jgi:two-component system, chemotaxis family, response regulator PixH
MTIDTKIATQVSPTAASPQSAKMATVLVVEDAPSERELMSHYLRAEGYSVIGAHSGNEGLDKAIAQRPDVIVTDVVMPGISGFELCRKLKRTPETQAVPVVMCTSKKQSIDRLWGMRQGAQVYLTKPYTKDELIQAVKTVLI